MSSLPSVFKMKNTMNAKVLEAVVAKSWQSQALLLRLITQHNEEILLIATDAAKTSLETIEKGVAYNFTVPGACVKTSVPAKTGVPSAVEIRIRYKMQYERAQEAWPTKVPYMFTPFLNLAQVPEGDWVDIVGFVHDLPDETSKTITPTKGDPYVLTSRAIILQNGEFHETLELLGDFSCRPLKIGDILAVRQAKMTVWNQIRKLSTGTVTHLRINPTADDGVAPPVRLIHVGSPTKKAAGMRDMEAISIADFCKQRESFVSAVRAGMMLPKSVRFEAMSQAKYLEYDYVLFEKGFPFYGVDANPSMKFPAVLKDASGQLYNVTLWDDSCKKLFEMDGATCHGLWEACTTPEGKEALLEKLNKNASQKFKFFLTLTVWCPDDDVVKALARIAVNQVVGMDA